MKNTHLTKRILPFVIFILILISLDLPNFIAWDASLYPDTYLLDLRERALISGALMAALLTLFSSASTCWLFFWILALSWLPISIVVRIHLYSPITANIVGLIAETTPQESLEFLKTLPIIFWCSILTWNILCYLAYRTLRKLHIKWEIKYRAIYFLIFSSTIIYNLLSTTPSETKNLEIKKTESKDLFKDSDYFSYLFDGVLSYSFPFELPLSYLDFQKKLNIVNNASKTLLKDRRTLHLSEKSPDIFVLIIGESSTRDRWGVFGYNKNTTPNLSKMSNDDSGLILFDKIVTESTATRFAVPLLLTHQPVLLPDGRVNSAPEHSIISLIRDSSIHTAWYSNQSTGGVHDGPSAVYAKESNETAFLNPSGFYTQGSYDEVLLQSLFRHIDSHKKTFTVLHTLGSHFNFAQRYPSKFEAFQPAMKNTRTLKIQDASREEISNAYDNSILYTDTLLHEIIEKIKSRNNSAVIFYISDHGQDTANSVCKSNPIGRVTASAYRIPALVWMSPTYIKNNPKIYNLALAHRHSNLTSSSTSDTIIQLYSGDSTSSIKDTLLNPPAEATIQRVYTPSGWVDFKESAKKDECLIH